MKNDGGRAFPQTANEFGEETVWPGMSLRDYFAAAALPEAQRVSANVCKPEEVVSMGVAVAYAWADAMLAERERGTE